MATKPEFAQPDGHRLARQLRRTGAVVLVLCLLAAGRIAWTEWRRTEPTMDELMPGSAAADSRQVGMMYGLLFRDVWQVWREMSQPYNAAMLISAAGVVFMLGCRSLARRHEDER